MISPEFDKDGYPTDETLDLIASWYYRDLHGLMAFVKEAWKYGDNHCIKYGRSVTKYFLSTGGWSGNEEIIRALERNVMFWVSHWYSSRRGGHYLFKEKKQ